MKIYISGSSKNMPRAKKAIRYARELGAEVFDWTEVIEQAEREGRRDRDFVRQALLIDIQEVKKARALVFLGSDEPSIGALAELGAASAWDIPIFFSTEGMNRAPASAETLADVVRNDDQTMISAAISGSEAITQTDRYRALQERNAHLIERAEIAEMAVTREVWKTINATFSSRGFNAFAATVHNAARAKGWYAGHESSLALAESDLVLQTIKRLALVTCEISESIEEVRKGAFTVYEKDGKPEGLPIELADAVIRILDLCAWLGTDLDAAIEAKTKFNKTREQRHGGKLA